MVGGWVVLAFHVSVIDSVCDGLLCGFFFVVGSLCPVRGSLLGLRCMDLLFVFLLANSGPCWVRGGVRFAFSNGLLVSVF